MLPAVRSVGTSHRVERSHPSEHGYSKKVVVWEWTWSVAHLQQALVVNGRGAYSPQRPRVTSKVYTVPASTVVSALQCTS
jgi:hypothetical protein